MIARRTIINTDPPEHTKLRKIVSGSFSQRATAVYQHFVEQLTEHVLDTGLIDGELEFVDAVAKEVPIRVLARIMGLPEADLDTFIDLGDRLIANTDPEVTEVVWGRDDTDAYRRFPFRSPYGKQLWELGREIVAPSCAAPRPQTPHSAGPRSAPGTKVVLWYVSGNRDEAEFADPDVFDVGRAPNRHLSFGRGGPHLCLGAHLARLEVKVVLAALAQRVASFELAGPPRRIRSNFTNGLRELPVRVCLA
jgi:cytochrome P450